MERCVVVLSGGQDSTTCLFLAIRDFGRENVRALTFDYGQRHRIEVEAARDIASLARVQHDVEDASVLGRLSESALTRRFVDVASSGSPLDVALPTTFTPSRNLAFIALASAFALSRGIRTIMLGVCETDFSGYPDCRSEFIEAARIAVSLGNGLPVYGSPLDRFRILTPLMHLSKRETVQLAASMPGCLAALAHSVTCYHGQVPGCGECPACVLRARGFAEAGVADPARP